MLRPGVCRDWRTSWYAVSNWQQMWSGVESDILCMTLTDQHSWKGICPIHHPDNFFTSSRVGKKYTWRNRRRWRRRRFVGGPSWVVAWPLSTLRGVLTTVHSRVPHPRVLSIDYWFYWLILLIDCPQSWVMDTRVGHPRVLSIDYWFYWVILLIDWSQEWTASKTPAEWTVVKRPPTKRQRQRRLLRHVYFFFIGLTT